ncbi:hypothetical protein [Nannocystis punicea]|uniref:Uncharacterized protein n=1 Tax=Nannocystis punicea TaxID=2995304 RepID=A0ABY7H0P7_9BACT|nr:hypothetical protein [Nannocystis poenicansa]WAS92782.1 hypothetical protein O0S08_41940 [Nannocystis poenicansa]
MTARYARSPRKDNHGAGSSQLRLAWPGSLPAEHEVVAEDVFAGRAGFRLDPGGNMHLAVNDDEVLGVLSSEIRYLMIGP